MSTAVIIEDSGANAEFHHTSIARLPRPIPKANEVLLKIGAVSLNHREIWILRKQFAGIVLGSVLGSDGVGRIEQLQDEASRFKAGDRVVIMPSEGWISDSRGPEVESEYILRGGCRSQGVFSQYFTVNQADIFKAPAHLTDVEAAALPLAGLTAYRALFTKGQVVKGRNLLITGIGGGVALFTLQFAVAIGANVYVTSSDESKIERAIQLGAKGGANYRQVNWVQQILQQTKGVQFDVVIDSANGSGAPIILSHLLARGGALVTYGQTAGGFHLDKAFFLRNIDIRGSTMGSRVEFERMLRFVEEHQIQPVVSQVWDGLENIPEAILQMRKGVQFGKLVVTQQESSSRTDASVKCHKAKLVQVPRPVPKTGEAVVKIEALALNHRELWIIEDNYQKIEFGSILGSDSVGRIVELNGESSKLKVGDRVLIMPSNGWISNTRGPELEGNYAIRGGSKSQ
ncbi:hypothetical protein BGZ65_001090, partial [Modicella reniformis]